MTGKTIKTVLSFAVVALVLASARCKSAVMDDLGRAAGRAVNHYFQEKHQQADDTIGQVQYEDPSSEEAVGGMKKHETMQPSIPQQEVW